MDCVGVSTQDQDTKVTRRVHMYRVNRHAGWVVVTAIIIMHIRHQRNHTKNHGHGRLALALAGMLFSVLCAAMLLEVGVLVLA